MLKRYNNKKNISGTLIRNAREEKGMSKVRLSQLLDTYRKESIACKRFRIGSNRPDIRYRPKPIKKRFRRLVVAY